MDIQPNPHRGNAHSMAELEPFPLPSTDAGRPLALVRKCPRHAPTPLLQSDALAAGCGVGQVWLKDERDRMGLGSFKALGAAYVIACDAAEGDLSGVTYVTASAGNHGLSVAAGARAFGARAVVYVAETVPESFAQRLRAEGAEVVREGADYEASMAAAAKSAEVSGWQLLSDSSWPGYMARPHRLMEGYLVLVDEIIRDMPQVPTHVVLQAGVGGLAGAAAALMRDRWGDAPLIAVVEPQAAPALAASIAAGAPLVTQGPVSDMGRLDCKEPSWVALRGLARDADVFLTISEEEGHRGADIASGAGFPTTASGAAGLAGLIAAADADALGLDETSRALVIVSEGPQP
ncbi:pyridoxal-phosphate dependent enzyme [Antarcticimicrobium luteum]|uniref:Pyridoxal-phosphate dependent enzyme n=1 Tax=Antarcticimicrobium luteum TaxID=2547397 RepID=A0A4R5V002_9RHOB|nr:pyridoxal-phosphate dependent enzyme [Antarcticimicrobium luteum]TDK45058.1 pyridoxal-phosphate dependent enzyme [Antarcticimicrobium luteum]